MTVRDVDHGYEALFRRLAQRNQGRVVDVGVMGQEGAGIYEGTGLTVADVASFHEFGRGVPERSFIRAYVDENREQIENTLRRMAQKVIKGEVRSFDAGLELIGQRIQNEIKKRIKAGIEPALAQSTIDRKGSKPPLIDTGQLINSITYELRQIAEGA